MGGEFVFVSLGVCLMLFVVASAFACFLLIWHVVRVQREHRKRIRAREAARKAILQSERRFYRVEKDRQFIRNLRKAIDDEH